MDDLNKERTFADFLKLRFSRRSEQEIVQRTMRHRNSMYSGTRNGKGGTNSLFSLNLTGSRSKESHPYNSGRENSLIKSYFFRKEKSKVAPETQHPVTLRNSKSCSNENPISCDRCDGPHASESCPYFKKGRESHPDGQKNFYKTFGGDSSLPGKRILAARIIRQPGDGNCLFHSMSYSLGDHCNASSLRSEICNFISNHPNFKICETPLSDWIKWDTGLSCVEYARRMRRGLWGGGIEMAVCSHIHKVNIHVYRKSSSSFTRISAFDYPKEASRKRVVRIVYQGGVHYDALLVPVP